MMIEIVWSVNIMVAILMVELAGSYIIFSLTTRNILLNIKWLKEI